MRNIVLFAASQAAWFVLVLGGARGFAWPGIAAAVACAALALALADDRRAMAALLAVAGLVGGGTDYLVSLTGIYEFAAASVAPAMRPVWFSALWVAFAALLAGPLAWLRGPCGAGVGIRRHWRTAGLPGGRGPERHQLP